MYLEEKFVGVIAVVHAGLVAASVSAQSTFVRKHSKAALEAQ